MSRFRQTIHNLLGVLPTQKGSRFPRGEATIADGSGKSKTNFALGGLKNKFEPDDLARLWISVGLVCPNTERDRWVEPLVSALSTCRGDVVEEGWRVLIARGEVASARVLAEKIAPSRQAIVLRALAADTNVAFRAHAMEWIAAGAWVSDPDVLVRGLSDPDGHVAAAAEAGVRRLVDEIGQVPHSADSVRGVAMDVLRRASAEFALHQSRAVAAGVVALTGPGADRAAWAMLAGDDSSRPFLVRAMRSGGHDAIRLRAWERLAEPWLTSAAVDRLRQTCGALQHSMVLSAAHLARSEPRRRAVAKLTPRDRAALISGLLPTSAGVVSKLGQEACVGVAQLMATLRVDVAARERWGRSVLGHPSAVVRFAAWRATPSRTAMDFAFDPDASVARSAATAASGLDGNWRALERSPHAEVRAIAAGESARLGLSWAETSAAMVGLRRRCHADPGGVEQEWRMRWERADAAERIVLMRVASRVGLADRVASFVQKQIVADVPVGTPEACVTATAVKLFGVGAAEAVSACLGAADPRVRANAVEACGGEVARAGVMLELKNDANHRVQANAIRRLALNKSMSPSAVLGEMVEMSRHAEPLHRLAGAWMLPRVAEVVGRRGVAQLIEQRLGVEQDLRVRARLTDAAARFCDDVGEGVDERVMEAA